MTTSSHGSSEGWVTREVATLVSAWHRGEDASARDVIANQPELSDDSIIRLIYEETCLRREAGQDVATAEVVGRYPRWADELRALLDCDRLIRSTHAGLIFPEAGETLGPFLLLAELGRGGSGRTFLASDPRLADRPVVVKVIPDDQDEHLALARLRHTHIVPLFSEHTFPERGLRGLCMPFLGGTSLGQILDDLADVPMQQRSGRLLARVLDRNTPETPATPPADGPFRRGLEQATYTQAMIWIAACLADALHYAHARGLVHMDVKPSNVLITKDGQPMLLDFHLARSPMVAGESVTDRLGGTPGWMAPEQENAMGATLAGRPLPISVDGRADIYSLGLLLREALSERTATPEIGPGRMMNTRQEPARIGLHDMIRRCLATDPQDRYRDAATLAEDLRRELNDLPLRGVRNRSPRERWRKWRRRHPGALPWGMVGLVLVMTVGLISAASWVAYRQMIGQLQVHLEDGRKARLGGRHEEAIKLLDRGLATAASLPVLGGLPNDLKRERQLAERGRLGAELHRVADRVRFRYGMDLPSTSERDSLQRLCSNLWDKRGKILPGDGDEATAKTTRADLLEMAALLVDLLTQPDQTDQVDKAQARALQVINEAEATCGPSFSLAIRRERIEAPDDSSTDAFSVPVDSAWEHYEQGRQLLRDGRTREAATAFREAIDLRPQEFWPNFFHGLSSYRLAHHEEAVADFRVCIVLMPDSATCHYNRALGDEALGRLAEARRGYNRALAIDPRLLEARWNRGVLSLREGRQAEAISDFQIALRDGPDRTTAGRIHLSLALARHSLGDRDRALAEAENAVGFGCVEAVALRDELRNGSPPAGSLGAAGR